VVIAARMSLLKILNCSLAGSNNTGTCARSGIKQFITWNKDRVVPCYAGGSRFSSRLVSVLIL